jgi:hypothetical protein
MYSSAVLQLHRMRHRMPADSCLQGRLLFSVCYPQGLVAGGLKAPSAVLCLNLGLHYLQACSTACSMIRLLVTWRLEIDVTASNREMLVYAACGPAIAEILQQATSNQVQSQYSAEVLRHGLNTRAFISLTSITVTTCY